ncbi:hypothetical protein [Gordonia paraffinivorans]|uniref:hypothetical protein n=1 Tax=Gordonia paraffinivorans TaxID=175628 RepID=UPI00242C5BF4|nr:hypothetical protein [Gordonia paraffinivorans]
MRDREQVEGGIGQPRAQGEACRGGDQGDTGQGETRAFGDGELVMCRTGAPQRVFEHAHPDQGVSGFVDGRQRSTTHHRGRALLQTIGRTCAQPGVGIIGEQAREQLIGRADNRRRADILGRGSVGGTPRRDPHGVEGVDRRDRAGTCRGQIGRAVRAAPGQRAERTDHVGLRGTLGTTRIDHHLDRQHQCVDRRADDEQGRRLPVRRSRGHADRDRRDEHCLHRADGEGARVPPPDSAGERDDGHHHDRQRVRRV